MRIAGQAEMPDAAAVLDSLPNIIAQTPHIQPWSTISGKPGRYPPITHQHSASEIISLTWTQITGTPTTFPPIPHIHDWADVTNKPTTFAPGAHTQDWSTITGKPSTYPPDAHTQDWATVTGKPSTFPPSTHTHAWAEVTGKPSTFPPDAHTQDWTTVTGKPSTFPPSSHTHAQSEITPVTGSFTIALTGVSGSVTGTAYYALGLGTVALLIPTLTGTANALGGSLTGLPVAIRPIRAQPQYGAVVNAGITQISRITVNTDGTITLSSDLLGGILGALLGKGVQSQTLVYTIL